MAQPMTIPASVYGSVKFFHPEGRFYTADWKPSFVPLSGTERENFIRLINTKEQALRRRLTQAEIIAIEEEASRG